MFFIFVDSDAAKAPQYSSIFETSDYVYFTFAEPALETFNSIGSTPSIYSRIGRVCKNDRGRGRDVNDDDAGFKFATLFKSRMLCGTPGMKEEDSNKYFKEEYQGFYANYLNEIGKQSVLLKSITY